MAKTNTTAALLASVIIATTTLLLNSCSDYDNGFDEAAIRYNQNFRELFGDIDPNQDWNLVRQLAMKNGGMSTREGDDREGGNVDNKNQWADPNYYNLAVPGFPDALGTYHVTKDYNGGDNTLYYSTEEWEQLAQNEKDALLPAGDVTDEEVLWVSQWFRSNYEPESDDIYWKDYFLQEISGDCDREVKEWTTKDGKKIPKSCDKGDKIPYCKIYKRTYDGGEHEHYEYTEDPIQLDWDVIKEDEDVSYNMEFLQIKISTYDDNDVNRKWNPHANLATDNDWEHVHDFNSGTGTNDFKSYDNLYDATGKVKIISEDLNYRTIQFFTGSGTADFAYYNSNAESKYFHKHVLKHLTFDIKQDETQECMIHRPRKCSNHHYDGYYLGFDYEYYKNASGDELTYKPRDGFYSNWILKISKGVDADGNSPSEYPKNNVIEQGLLVCEDLGDFDFDFNDVVLRLQHVKYTESEGATPVDKLRVTAMAAGGTLPSQIYYKENKDDAEYKAMNVVIDSKEKTESNEVHKLLYGKAPQIINAGPEFGGAGMTWISQPITVPTEAQNAYASYVFDNALIQIVVDDGKNNGKGTVIRPISSGYHTEDKYDYTEGDAPQMMFLPIDFLWPQEKNFIGDAYKKFGDWVTNVDNVNWYTEPEMNKVTWRYVSPTTSQPSEGTGTEDPGLYAWWNSRIDNGGTIYLPNDENDIIYVELRSNSDGEFSINFENNKPNGVDAQLLSDGKTIEINRHSGSDQAIIIVTQAAAGKYASASMKFTIAPMTSEKLRWRNGTQEGLQSLDIIAGEEITVSYATAKDDNDDVTMTVNTNDLTAIIDKNNKTVTIKGEHNCKGTITLTQETKTQGTQTAALDVTVYERCESNGELEAADYAPAIIYSDNNNKECHVLATTLCYEYLYGISVKVIADNAPDKIKITIKGSNAEDVIRDIQRTEDGFTFNLTADELNYLAGKFQNYTGNPSPLKISGVADCQVYIKGLPIEDMYGEEVACEFVEGEYKYTIPASEFEGYDSSIIVTFFGSGGSNCQCNIGEEKIYAPDNGGWHSFDNGSMRVPLTAGQVSQAKQQGLTFIYNSGNPISNLTARIKEASSSAKKRIIRRK